MAMDVKCESCKMCNNTEVTSNDSTTNNDILAMILIALIVTVIRVILISRTQKVYQYNNESDIKHGNVNESCHIKIVMIIMKQVYKMRTIDLTLLAVTPLKLLTRTDIVTL